MGMGSGINAYHLHLVPPQAVKRNELGTSGYAARSNACFGATLATRYRSRSAWVDLLDRRN